MTSGAQVTEPVDDLAQFFGVSETDLVKMERDDAREQADGRDLVLSDRGGTVPGALVLQPVTDKAELWHETAAGLRTTTRPDPRDRERRAPRPQPNHTPMKARRRAPIGQRSRASLNPGRVRRPGNRAGPPRVTRPDHPSGGGGPLTSSGEVTHERRDVDGVDLHVGRPR